MHMYMRIHVHVHLRIRTCTFIYSSQRATRTHLQQPFKRALHIFTIQADLRNGDDIGDVKWASAGGAPPAASQRRHGDAVDFLQTQNVLIRGGQVAVSLQEELDVAKVLVYGCSETKESKNCCVQVARFSINVHGL